MKIAVEVGDIYLNEFVIMFLVVTQLQSDIMRHHHPPPPLPVQCWLTHPGKSDDGSVRIVALHTEPWSWDAMDWLQYSNEVALIESCQICGIPSILCPCAVVAACDGNWVWHVRWRIMHCSGCELSMVTARGQCRSYWAHNLATHPVQLVRRPPGVMSKNQ